MKNSFKETLIKSLAYSGLVLALAQPLFNAETVSANPNTNTPIVEQLEEEEQSIQQLLESQEENLEEIVQKISDKEEEVLILLNQISTAEADIEELQDKIDEKNKEITQLEKEIDQKEEELKEQMRLYDENLEVAKSRAQTLQVKGNSRFEMYLEIILSDNGFSDTLAQIRAIEVLLDAHDTQIHAIYDHAEEIEKTKSSLSADYRKLVDDRSLIEDAEIELKEKRVELIEQQRGVEDTLESLENERTSIEEAYNRSMDELSKVRENIEGERLLAEIQREEAQRITASPSVGISSSSGQRDRSLASSIIADAENFLGVPYLWGGTTPSGFDCSGLVQYVYRQNGIDLPRVTQDQVKVGSHVELSEVQPGDLLFWDRGGDVYHVAIYTGNGNYIHAPKPGDVVKVANVEHFTPSSARRVLPNEPAPVASNSTNSNRGELIGDFRATAYAVGGWAVPGTVTANGTDISNTIYADGHRIIAVDPNVIPLNSVVWVEVPGWEPFTAKAADTGGMIKGNIVDILFDNVPDAMSFGRKSGLKIYTIK